MRYAVLLLFACIPSFGAVAHVKQQGTTSTASGASTTFSYTASATGDAVIFMMGCSSTSATSTTLAGSGWTITQVHAPAGSSATGFSSTFKAYAPNTTATTFTVTWSSGCGNFFAFLIDEFSGADATNFVDASSTGTTFGSSGGCSATVTPVSANDMIWSGCMDSITAHGSGFTTGANDGSGDWTEFELLSGGAGTPVTATFVPTTGTAYNARAIAIKPAAGGGGSSPTCTRTLLGVGPC